MFLKFNGVESGGEVELVLHAVIDWSVAARRVLLVGGGGAPIKFFGVGGVSFLPASAAWRGVDPTLCLSCFRKAKLLTKILTKVSITGSRW